jgi:hypothetical protein
LAFGLFVLTVGCSDDDTSTATTLGSTTTSTIPTPDSAVVTTAPTVPATTVAAVPPPTTVPPNRPSIISTLAIDESVVPYGGALEVTLECASPVDPFGEVYLVDPATGAPWGALARLAFDSELAAYAGTLTLPYWLGPGFHELAAGCPQADDLEPGETALPQPAPIEFEVTEPESGGWDAWHPIEPASLEGGAMTWGVAANATAFVSARCDPSVVPGGARFVVWGHYVDVDSGLDQPYFAIEFPVAENGYTVTDEGVLISAELTLDPSAFPSPSTFTSTPTLTALCTTTSTPFSPEGEPPLDSDGPRLEIYL